MAALPLHLVDADGLDRPRTRVRAAPLDRAFTARNTVLQLVPKMRATSLQLSRRAQRARNHR